MRLTIGITGHRDIVPGDEERLRSEIRSFYESMQARFPELPLEIIGALAEGADTLAVEVALDMGIPFTAVMPMPEDRYLIDFESDQAKKTFNTLLARAEHVVDLPVRKGADLDEQEARSWQYAQLGVFISDHCQILLALWDGKDNHSLGGTGQVVRYHLTAVKPGFEDELPAANLLADNENDLCFHMVTARHRADGDPAEGLQVGNDRWMTSHFNQPEGLDIPAEYGLMLDRLSEFKKDSKRYSESIANEADRLLENTPDCEVPPGATLVEQLFMTSDWLAGHFQKRFNRSLSAMYLLAVVMGLVFIIYSEKDGYNGLLVAFLVLFFAGVALHVISRRRQWHRKYLDYRALAEALRVQLYWDVSGVLDPGSAGFAYDTFLHKQDVELGWIRHVMRTPSTRRVRGSAPSPEWLPWTIDHWIGDENTGAGQLGYYALNAKRNEINYQRTRTLGSVCLWSGISLAILLLFFGGRLDGDLRDLALILMGILPLVAGVREAMSNKKAEKELIKQYQFMQKVFANARRLLSGCNEDKFQRKVLRALGEAALGEGAEWILMHRERHIEHGGL